jgi:large subunit ribosomal protein L25
LPEFIAVDLSGLKKGASLHLNDITLPKGVSAVTHGVKNPVLVSVVVVAAPEVVVADPAADAKAAKAAKAGAKPAAKK